MKELVELIEKSLSNPDIKSIEVRYQDFNGVFFGKQHPELILPYIRITKHKK